MTPASIASSTAHRMRASALGVALTAALGCGAALSAQQMHRSWSSIAGQPALTPADTVPIVLWAGLVIALLWAALLVLMAIARLLPRPQAEAPANDRSLHGSTPAVLRVAALLLLLTGAVCGQSTAMAAPAPVSASEHVRPAHGGRPPSLDGGLPVPSFGAEDAWCSSAPSPGWAPSAPAPVDQCAVDSSPLVTGSTHGADRTVVVHRGDSLWSLVARHLGAEADPATVAQAWPTWYAANRTVIGDDPNHLLPGEVLQVPNTQVGAR